MLNNYSPVIDLTKSNNYQQINFEIDKLLHRYFSCEKLNQHIEDFPTQLKHYQARTWQKISWKQINSTQIINLDISLFLDILSGIINTEVPIGVC